MTDPHGVVWVAPLADGGWGVFWAQWKDGADPLWTFGDRRAAWNAACGWTLGARRSEMTGEPLLEGGVRLKTA